MEKCQYMAWKRLYIFDYLLKMRNSYIVGEFLLRSEALFGLEENMADIKISL